AYLARVEPARCFQTAKPGAEVAPLEVASPLRTKVAWGDAAVLWVKTVPNSPVTFTAFQGGIFKENGVGSVSVRSDARGLAAAHSPACPGISGDVTAAAGSPLAPGTHRSLTPVQPS